MKILSVTSSYPLNQESISGAFVRQWAKSLVQGQGHSLKVLTWRAPSDGPPYQDDGIEVVEVPYAARAREMLFHGAGAMENVRLNRAVLRLIPKAWWAMKRALEREITTWEPDVLVAHWLLPAGLLVQQAAARWDIPSGIVTHSAGIHLLERLPVFLQKNWAKPTFQHLPMTAVSSLNVTRLESMLDNARQLTQLPMGYTLPQRVDPSPREDLLVMGRLVPIKRVDRVIDAIASTSPNPPTLHIMGDGPLRKKLERQAPSWVKFHGTVTGDKRALIWARCKLAIFGSQKLPSGRQEGLPVSFLETCAAGVVPCVAHLPGAAPFLVDPLKQQLPDTDDMRLWGAQIARLLADKELDSMRELTKQKVKPLAWSELGEAWGQWVKDVALKTP